jgi:hypothetical protein
MAIYVSNKAFQNIRENDEVEPEVLYVVNQQEHSSLYAWSPDGEGFYFYANREEFENEHGKEDA